MNDLEYVKYIIKCDNSFALRKRTSSLLKKGFVLTSIRFKTLDEYKQHSKVSSGNWNYNRDYKYYCNYDRYNYNDIIRRTCICIGLGNCLRTMFFQKIFLKEGRIIRGPDFINENTKYISFDDFVKDVLPTII